MQMAHVCLGGAGQSLAQGCIVNCRTFGYPTDLGLFPAPCHAAGPIVPSLQPTTPELLADAQTWVANWPVAQVRDLSAQAKSSAMHPCTRRYDKANGHAQGCRKA